MSFLFSCLGWAMYTQSLRAPLVSNLAVLRDYLEQRGIVLPAHICSWLALFDHMFMSLRSPSSHDAFWKLVAGIIDVAFESKVDTSESDVWPIALIELQGRTI